MVNRDAALGQVTQITQYNLKLLNDVTKGLLAAGALRVKLQRQV